MKTENVYLSNSYHGALPCCGIYIRIKTIFLFLAFFCFLQEARADFLNGSFSNASQNWIIQQNFFCSNSGFTDYRTSPGYAWFASSTGQPADGIWGTLTQTIAIPTSFSSGAVQFYTKITTAEVTTTAMYDIMNCTLTDATTNQTSMIKLSNLDKSSGYVLRSIPLLSSMAGHNITLTFYAENDGGKPTVFRIDDVSLVIGGTTGSITVTNPSSGAEWLLGSSQTIRWTSSGVTGNVKIEINGNYPTGAWETLYSSISNDNSEPWTVTGMQGNAKRIRVTSVNNSAISGMSENFSIVNPTITITSPASGASWTIGNQYEIKWNSQGVTGNVKIEINGNYPTGAWETLYSSISNDNSEPWTVTGMQGNAKRIRISSVNNPSITGMTENFSLVSPSITVISPNGGESWPIGSNQEIKWISNGVTGKVKIEINGNYPNGIWEPLYAGITNDNSEFWDVTGMAGNAKRIRISSVNDPTVQDISNSNFTLTNEATRSSIQFSGLTWDIKSGVGGPGPNNWYNGVNSVWVENGELHLKIRKIGGIWYSSEVYSREIYGYGTYTFFVASNVENYDPNIVVGLFNYENDQKEIDIEFAKWGSQFSNSGWYVIQHLPSSSNVSFPLNLQGTHSTHKFDWNPDRVFFQSYHGHYDVLPSQNELIKEWTYSGQYNPEPNAFRIHLNFWLFQGMAPTDQNEAEVVISKVTFSAYNGITKKSNLLPTKYELSDNYPNPFNNSTSFQFSIPEETRVKMTIIDVLGNEIAVLVNDQVDIGTYEVNYSAVNLASGVYFCYLKTSGFSAIKKIVLMK